MEINVFGVNVNIGRKKETEPIQEQVKEINEIPKIVDLSITDDSEFFNLDEGKHIVGISEEVSTISPTDLRKLVDSNEIKLSNLLDAIKSDYSVEERYKEDEEMGKDTIVGSAMELMADDCCAINPNTNKIIRVSSEDKQLEVFLNKFLDENVKIEQRVWEWAFEIVKHGDLKLRRRELAGKNNVSNVYYENVLEGHKVTRIEYLGSALGFLNEEEKMVLEKPENYVHFMNTKLPNRKKIKMKVKDSNGNASEVTCYRVGGTCIVDNARYIYRVVNLLDNMLIMSRVARSTQFNIVKIEVGNASPQKTQEILMDVKRRIEGNTKMSKGKGMKSDPSPIPVNSNIYIPTRDGKGDIQIDSVNDNIDVKSIVDIDYFKNKLFATLRTSKVFLGWEEALPGSMGNTSLVKLDIRYARTVQRVQNILKEGIRDLCNNYLAFRGRVDDKNNFEIDMRSLTGADDLGAMDDLLNHISLFDSTAGMLQTYGEYVDQGKVFIYLLHMLGIDPSDVGSKKLVKMLDDIKAGKEIEEETPKQPSEEDTGTGEEGMGNEEEQ